MTLFKSRLDAGQKLSRLIRGLELKNPKIFALPRGGVEVGFEVSKKLALPLEVVIARKIASPINPEYGLGAVSEDEIPFFNPDLSKFTENLSFELDEVIKKEILELRRRKKMYRGGDLNLGRNENLMVLDDGIATGVTAAAAGKFLKKFNPKKLFLIVPVAPKKLPHFLTKIYDQVISLNYLENFRGVGEWYETFPQLDDHQVLAYLGKEPLFLHP
jgi:putative phosphoribosyl transferase